MLFAAGGKRGQFWKSSIDHDSCTRALQPAAQSFENSDNYKWNKAGFFLFFFIFWDSYVMPLILQVEPFFSKLLNTLCMKKCQLSYKILDKLLKIETLFSTFI